MAPKSKKEILRDETFKQLKDIKNRVDPRTYASFERDIYKAIGFSALNKMQGKIEAIKEMQNDKKYTKTSQRKKTNEENKIKNKEAIEHFKTPLKNYFVKASVEITYTYQNVRKSRYSKDGRVKGQMYESTFERKKINDILKPISARSPEEAKKKYERLIYEEFGDYGGFGNKNSNAQDTLIEKSGAVNSINNISIIVSGSHNHSPSEMMMKKYTPLKYNFIPSDDKLLSSPGFCVPDVFIGTYSKFIKKLTLDYFIKLCYEARGEDRTVEKQKSLLDFGLEDEEDDDDKNKTKWDISKGVSPVMIKYICKKLNISMYAFDITKQCFLKTISTNRNYPAFIFYAVSNHCYHITDKEETKTLVEKAKDIEHKIKSNCIIEEVIEKNTSNNFSKMEIKENIKIEELKDHKNCIIIYNKNDINEELDKIIGHYNYIPKIYNHKYDIIYIHFDLDNVNVHLYVDPNDDLLSCDYKYIKSECEKLNLEFRNQSFAQMITQLKKRYFDNINKRRVFSQKERLELWKSKANNTCQKCNKNVKVKEFEIDHIKPLAIGGNNEESNLQILCKGCHKNKTSDEQEQGYFKMSETESSFNTVTKEIFDSILSGSYAFIEPITEKIPKSMVNNKIYNIDINKCRKNQLYYNKYAYPLFTVMDKPECYKGQKQTGLYYVETLQYFPFRGNGWYNYPLIKYGLDNDLINESEIKYVIVSSLEVPADYYNNFIDYLYSNVEESKLSVNAMIGNFKPRPREQWKSELITEDINEAFYYHLKFKGSMIDVRNINDKSYYQIYSTTLKSRQETDAPIYKQIIELESIELHKMKTLIESKGGLCLDLNTDCISCVFKNNILPQNKIVLIHEAKFY